MIISGTRGAISIPLAGFMTYFILRKNIRLLGIGVALISIVFIFFKFTTIGQDNANIRRMRTAFDPNDASLQVRLNNQKLLKHYLASRPFGGGIGHGGVKAQKYLPNAFLSQVATDSWYVLIWVEQGIIGLLLHLFILFYTVIKGSLKVMFRIQDPELKLKISALIAGMVGVMVASYGNAVLGGMPTGILIYISMAIILNCETLDKKIIQTNNLEKNK
jgi:O-antigen ligase